MEKKNLQKKQCLKKKQMFPYIYKEKSNEK